MRNFSIDNAQQVRHADFGLHSTMYFNGLLSLMIDWASDQVRFESTQPKYDDVSVTLNHRHRISFAVAYAVGFSLPSVFVPNTRHMLSLENERSFPIQERGGYR